MNDAKEVTLHGIKRSKSKANSVAKKQAPQTGANGVGWDSRFIHSFIQSF